MLIAGWLAIALVGITLGMVGGGGSILTVPILTYLFGLSPTNAAAYSLFLVGTTSVVGAVGAYRRDQLVLGSAVGFAIPAIAVAFLVRALLIPRLPEQIAGVGTERVLLSLFALVMVAAATAMLRPKSSPPAPASPARAWVVGALVGLLAGLLGAGGGFLIVPSLVAVLGIEMRKAIGTSLAIIALQSLSGFTGDVLGGRSIQWAWLLAMTGVAIAGIIAGAQIGARVKTARLRSGFGWLILVLGVAMLLEQIVSQS